MLSKKDVKYEGTPELRKTSTSKTKEASVNSRQIIGHFLTDVVLIARKLFCDERLDVDHEFQVPPTMVLGVGMVNGPLDFLTARAVGGLQMGNNGFFPATDIL
jgi:hypothetical protein